MAIGTLGNEPCRLPTGGRSRYAFLFGLGVGFLGLAAR